MERKIKKVVFLDRDGVINQDSPDYIKSWDEFEFIPGSIEAISNLTAKGFDIIIITNQSAVGRKMITMQDLNYMHQNMVDQIEAKGGKICDIFYCPHLPDAGCECRKPNPGMIYQAKGVYQIDLAEAFMVGDSVKDVECARNAGCGHVLLVKTGNGNLAQKILSEKNNSPDFIAADLKEAAEWILIRD